MGGLFFRLRLLISLMVFAATLLYGNIFERYKSFVVVLLLLLLAFSGFYTEFLIATNTQNSVTEITPLEKLILADLDTYALTTSSATLLDLRIREKQWIATNMQHPNSRDILLNGALLYAVLGKDEQALMYFNKAKSFDPNNPIFTIPFFSLLKQ